MKLMGQGCLIANPRFVHIISIVMLNTIIVDYLNDVFDYIEPIAMRHLAAPYLSRKQRIQTLNHISIPKYSLEQILHFLLRSF